MRQKTLEINGDIYKILFSRRRIAKKVKELAARIKADYLTAEKPPIILIVLTGGMMFGKDLVEALDEIGLVNHVDTVGLKRYSEDEQGGAVIILSEPHADLSGRDIIVVEDVIDHGVTMNFLDDYLKHRNLMNPPKSIAYCALGLKASHGPLKFEIKYLGFDNLGPEWIVGYGLDANQSLRGLKDIWVKAA